MGVFDLAYWSARGGQADVSIPELKRFHALVRAAQQMDADWDEWMERDGDVPENAILAIRTALSDLDDPPLHVPPRSPRRSRGMRRAGGSSEAELKRRGRPMPPRSGDTVE